jgi:uncharacterized coiled-coil DUF342 family protein
MSKQLTEARKRIAQLRSSLTMSQADLTCLDRALDRLSEAERLLDEVDADEVAKPCLNVDTYDRLDDFVRDGEED